MFSTVLALCFLLKVLYFGRFLEVFLFYSSTLLSNSYTESGKVLKFFLLIEFKLIFK